MISFLVNHHPPRGIATLLSHSDETLDTRSTSNTNQTPRDCGPTLVRFCDENPSDDPQDSRSRRFYLWPREKNARFCKGQTRATSPDLTGHQHANGTGLFCLGGTVGQVRYLEYLADFRKQRHDPWSCSHSCPRKRMIGPPSNGKLLLCLSGL